MSSNVESAGTIERMRRYKRLLRWCTLVGGFFLLVTTAFTTVDVAGRYLANTPLPASFEVTTTLLVFIVFLSLAHTQARGEHLRLGFVHEKSGPRTRAVLDSACFLLGFLITALMTWQAFDYTWTAYRTHEFMQGIWRVPYFPSRLGLSIGMLLLCIQYGADFVYKVRELSISGKAVEAKG